MALVATIGGSVVALAGVGVSAWSNWLQQGTARDLASKQHEHERELARGGRLYERRAPIYEQMLKLLNVWMERVDATEPIWKYADDPGPPDPPDLEESRAMQVQLSTHGSPEVSDAYRAFGEALREFAQRVDAYRLIRSGEDAEGNLADSASKMEEARGKVREALRTLERLVSDELAGF